jgi:ABC-type antimicrobial peptide transport system permease subunit
MFDANDRDGSLDVVLVNASLAAKLWPGQDPIGKQVRPLVDRRGALFTVVGVVGVARDWRVDAKDQLELYVPFAQRPPFFSAVVVRSSTSLRSVSQAFRSTIRELLPYAPIRLASLASNIDDTMADRRFIGGVLLAFAGAVLVLTVVGTFGAVSYAVSMRTREIGIRLAIGATPRRIWLGVEGAMLRIVAVGSAAGIVIAWNATRALSSLLYDLTPHDALSFVIAPALVCLAATIAATPAAYRAAHIDPASPLRAE